jgi:proline dehydrogenase
MTNDAYDRRADWLPEGPEGAAIRDAFLADERTTLVALAAQVTQVTQDDDAMRAVAARARAWVEAVRTERQAQGGIESFLQQYDLSTPEGVLLMCVAEALLRIPDAATADALIRDKLSRGDWDRHLGESDSLLVNASTWGLMLTGRLTRIDREDARDPRAWYERFVARAGEPVVRLAIRQAMKLMAEQFVLGRTIEEAVARSRTAEQSAYRHSYDMLGEAAVTADDADRYFAAYRHAIEVIGEAANPDEAAVFARPSISVKLSALHPRYEYPQRERVLDELAPAIVALARDARARRIGMTIDAEEAERLELSLELFARVRRNGDLDGWDGLGLALQAYQKRARAVVGYVVALARETRTRIPVRLVKGAYWDTEIKRAQVQGLAGYPVFTRKAHTDLSYLACARAARSGRGRLSDVRDAQRAHDRLGNRARSEPRYERVRVPAPARHGRCALSAGPHGSRRAARRLPRLRTGGRPSRPPAVSRAATARERREHVVRQPDRRPAHRDRRSGRRSARACARLGFHAGDAHRVARRHLRARATQFRGCVARRSGRDGGHRCRDRGQRWPAVGRNADDWNDERVRHRSRRLRAGRPHAHDRDRHRCGRVQRRSRARRARRGTAGVGRRAGGRTSRDPRARGGRARSRPRGMGGAARTRSREDTRRRDRGGARGRRFLPLLRGAGATSLRCAARTPVAHR